MYTDVFNDTCDIVKFLFSNHNDCYTSSVFVGKLSNGSMVEYKYDLKNLDKLKDFKYSKSCDYYITANTMKNNRPRNKNELFGLHNICIDIDLHYNFENVNKVASSLRFFLFEDDCSIPIPNILVHTGRGIQLWWHFEEVSSRLLFMYQAVTQFLINELDKLIGTVETLSNLKIDVPASRNVVGYFRLPFTLNTKSSTFAIADMLNPDSYDLCYLFDEYCEKDSISDNDKQVSSIHHNEQQVTEYTSLLMKRKQFLEDYCGSRNFSVVGSRDLVLFLYCVCIYQLIDTSHVMTSLKFLNNKFSEPLPQCQLDSIFTYVDKKKVLRFKQETFLSFLPQLTDAERKSYISSNKHNYSRDIKRKLSKEQRNEKIVSLFKDNVTIYQISKEVDCSLMTVKNVLKSLNLRRK